MASYSGEIDSALIAKLLADATLAALMPDGVFYELASAGMTRFVIVKLMAHSVTRQFGGRAFESPLYLVKAVELGTGTVNTKAAAARIDVLLDGPTGAGSTLTVPGYGTAQTGLEEYVRYTEADPENADARWQHRGGLYTVFASPA
jgi:hypothetical protein